VDVEVAEERSPERIDDGARLALLGALERAGARRDDEDGDQGAAHRSAKIPIRFVDREHGGSKMSRSIVLEAIWKVPVLRFRALTGRL